MAECRSQVTPSIHERSYRPHQDQQAVGKCRLALHPAASAVLLAALRRASQDSQILVTSHSPELLAKANAVRSDVPTTVVLAHREYETWFLAAAESLRGCAGLPAGLDPPANPERIRGAKQWLGRQMDASYDPIIHQAAFTARFDLSQAKTIPSFARFISKVLS